MEANILKFIPLGGNGLYFFRAKPFFEFVCNALKESPFCLLAAPPKAFYTYENGQEIKTKELAKD